MKNIVKKPIILIASLLTVATIAVGTVTFARSNERFAIFNNLNLDSATKDKLKSILKKQHEEYKDDNSRKNIAQAFDNYLAKPSVSTNDFNSLVDELSTNAKSDTQKRTDLVGEVHAILNTQQREQLANNFLAMWDKRHASFSDNDRMNRWMTHKLNLTESQSKQLKDLKTKIAENFNTTANQQFRADITTSFKKDTFNKDEFNTLLTNKIDSLNTNLKNLSADAVSITNSLTKEQKDTLIKMKDNMKAKRGMKEKGEENKDRK